MHSRLSASVRAASPCLSTNAKPRSGASDSISVVFPEPEAPTMYSCMQWQHRGRGPACRRETESRCAALRLHPSAEGKEHRPVDLTERAATILPQQSAYTPVYRGLVLRMRNVSGAGATAALVPNGAPSTLPLRTVVVVASRVAAGIAGRHI